jgi:hypothetical protein
VPPLHRAVPLAQEEDVSVRVADDLRLDMMRALDVTLEEDLGPAEIRERLARRAPQ